MRIKFFLIFFITFSLSAVDQEIEDLKARLEKEDNQDQIWECKFRLGVAFEKQGTWNEALYWYLEAFQEIPSKTLPLLHIAHYYRAKGENDLAYIFARHGSRDLPSPNFRLQDDLS